MELPIKYSFSVSTNKFTNNGKKDQVEKNPILSFAFVRTCTILPFFLRYIYALDLKYGTGGVKTDSLFSIF
jgi:hypothetical protein